MHAGHETGDLVRDELRGAPRQFQLYTYVHICQAAQAEKVDLANVLEDTDSH